MNRISKNRAIIFFCIGTMLLLTACSSKTYEADTFPKGDWQPINPEDFNKSEAERILEGERGF